MKTFFAERQFEVMNGLGEGPLWHPIKHRLYWTDILTGTLYRADPLEGTFEKMFFDLLISAFAFARSLHLKNMSSEGSSLMVKEPDFGLTTVQKGRISS